MEASYECRAKASVIWSLWSDPKSWPEWDESLEGVQFSGPFSVGNKGIMKEKNAKAHGFRILHIDNERCFSKVVKRFLTTIVFTQEVLQFSEKSIIVTHRVIVGGFFAPFLRYTWAKKLKKVLPNRVYALVQLAEKHV